MNDKNIHEESLSKEISDKRFKTHVNNLLGTLKTSSKFKMGDVTGGRVDLRMTYTIGLSLAAKHDLTSEHTMYMPFIAKDYNHIKKFLCDNFTLIKATIDDEIKDNAPRLSLLLDYKGKMIMDLNTGSSSLNKKRVHTISLSVVFYNQDDSSLLTEIYDLFSSSFTYKPIKNYTENKVKVSMLTKNSMGSYRMKNSYLKPLNVNLDLNYNDDLRTHDDKINSFLKDDRPGLVILHGEPGTGKTTYIRSLIERNPESKFVIVNQFSIKELDTAGLNSYLSDEENIVLIMEDAEALLKNRAEGNSIISVILNYTSGLLGEMSKIKVIATYNVDQNIDPALLRKGRTRIKYEFKNLTEEKARNLHKYLGRDYSGEDNLAEIYNISDVTKTEDASLIGFS